MLLSMGYFCHKNYSTNGKIIRLSHSHKVAGDYYPKGCGHQRHQVIAFFYPYVLWFIFVKINQQLRTKNRHKTTI